MNNFSPSTSTFREQFEKLRVVENKNCVYQIARLTDYVAQMIDAFILLKNPKIKLNIYRSSFSQKIELLKQYDDKKLVTLVSRFRSQKNSLSSIVSLNKSFNEILETGLELLEHLNFGDEAAVSRIPEATTIINSVSVETVEGYKSFNLIHGDIAVVNTDLLVISTHANVDEPPSGQLIRALSLNFDTKINPNHKFMHLSDQSWTCFQEEGTASFSYLLTLRMPKISKDHDQSKFYNKLVPGIYASIAALEHLGYKFKLVTLPVLYAQRLGNYMEGVKSLITHSLNWLKKSNYTHTVQFVIYYSDELNEWDYAMNQILERSYIPPNTNLILKGLINEIVLILKSSLSNPLSKTIEPLLRALEKIDRICIEHVGVFGRKFAEEFTILLMKKYNLKASELFINNLDILQKSGRLAPWILSYLHSLRVFGNEIIHTRQSIKYVPNKLTENDLNSILISIKALLLFWNNEIYVESKRDSRSILNSTLIS
jgi:hypothetical protein